MDARPTTDNPLGLNLDFLYGRGYLWAETEHVSDWVTLKNLRMEIPDLTFPFDVRGGLSRFRDTRCLVREIDLEITEAGVAELLKQASDDLDGFCDVEVRFLDGVALVGTRVQAFGVDSFMTFRVGAMPAERADSSTVRMLAHDFRSYGPLPCPVMQLGHTFLRSVVKSDAIAKVGAGTSFALSFERDTIRLRPLKLLLLHVFASHGWKLPNLSRVEMGDLILKPGVARLSARSDDETWVRQTSTSSGSPHIARALADDEARTLFGDGDAAVYAGRAEQALRVYQSFQNRYRSHAGLVRRLLDVLLSNPDAANLAEAESLCRDLETRDEASLVAALGRARVAEVDADREKIAAAYRTLSAILEDRGDTLDQAYCEVVASRALGQIDAQEAVSRLTQVLRSEPRNRPALGALRKIYERTDRPAELEDVLKRLTGVAEDTQALVETYLALARHLMYRQGQIGEARAFLERALRHAPDHFQLLDALGESWVLSGDPARAIKTLGGAARQARERGDSATASRLAFRIGRLWNDALHNPEQALMQVRRALDLWEEGDKSDPLEMAQQLRYAATLCEADSQKSEAIAYWTEALAALQLAEGRASGDDRVAVRRSLAATHRDVATAYRARGRHDVAANHERRLVEMDPTDVEAIDSLEQHYREFDDIGRFAGVMRDAVERIGPNPESLALRTRLAELYNEAGRTDDAIRTLEEALAVAPGAERVRRILAALLVETGDAERLRNILTALRHRVQQRDNQWAIAVDLGDLCLDILDDPAAAATAYHDATQILPARREAYRRCRLVLEQLANECGWDGASPLGATIGEDLLELWQQLADMAQSTETRATLLDEISDLALRMGDDQRARAARSQRQELGALGEASEADEFERELAEHSLANDSDWSDPELDWEAEEKGNGFVREKRTRLMKSPEVTDGNETSAPWKTEVPSGIDQREVDTLEIDRAPPTDRYSRTERADESGWAEEGNPAATEVRETLANALEGLELLDDSSAAEVVDTPDRHTFRNDSVTTPRLTVDPDADGGGASLEVPKLSSGEMTRAPTDRPLVFRAPNDRREFDEAREVPPPLKSFRKSFEETTRRPPPLPDLDELDENSALARILRRSAIREARRNDISSDALPGELQEREASDDAPDEQSGEQSEEQSDAQVDELEAETVDRGEPDPEVLESDVKQARKQQDLPALAEALMRLLQHKKVSASMDEERRTELVFELAELLYYDLEESDRALDWLLEVRRLDPSGYGARPGVLNAIEAIYEERGSIDGRVEILKTRLERAEAEEMADTYRLLIAQLEWEEREDPVEARRWLQEVIDRDDRHEGARRLLADIAQEAGEWEGAAEHLRVALSVSGEGLDSVELEKRLARLVLDRLDRPKDALKHFRAVQKDAPGDAGILEGIRACQRALGDWEGFVASLAEELRLLLGRPLLTESDSAAASATDWLLEIDAEAVPQPLRMPASQVLADLARTTQDELQDDARAHHLWGLVIALWGEDVEALERRIDLDRKLEDHVALASDLEDYASMLLDWNARLDALLQCARVRAEQLDDGPGARELLQRALEEVEALPEAPDNVDEARRTLEAWREG